MKVGDYVVIKPNVHYEAFPREVREKAEGLSRIWQIVSFDGASALCQLLFGETSYPGLTGDWWWWEKSNLTTDVASYLRKIAQ